MAWIVPFTVGLIPQFALLFERFAQFPRPSAHRVILGNAGNSTRIELEPKIEAAQCDSGCSLLPRRSQTAVCPELAKITPSIYCVSQ